MTPVVQQAGEPTDADRFKQLLDRFEAQLRYAYEHGGGHAGHMANAHATRKKIDALLASRPQQPQAETPPRLVSGGPCSSQGCSWTRKTGCSICGLDWTPPSPQAETPLTDEQIDAIADSIMEPPDTSDAAEEDMDRAVLRKFARAIAALSNTGAHPPGAEPTHRHIKLGTFYMERGRGMLQTDRTLEDEAELVGYQGVDGRWWFRPVEEFDDAARFERVAHPPEARADAGWISVQQKPIPTDCLVDIYVPGIERRAGCYYDRICDEWRQIERGILARFKRDRISHWMPVPLPPEAQETKT